MGRKISRFSTLSPSNSDNSEMPVIVNNQNYKICYDDIVAPYKEMKQNLENTKKEISTLYNNAIDNVESTGRLKTTTIEGDFNSALYLPPNMKRLPAAYDITFQPLKETAVFDSDAIDGDPYDLIVQNDTKFGEDNPLYLRITGRNVGGKFTLKASTQQTDKGRELYFHDPVGDGNEIHISFSYVSSDEAQEIINQVQGIEKIFIDKLKVVNNNGKYASIDYEYKSYPIKVYKDGKETNEITMSMNYRVQHEKKSGGFEGDITPTQYQGDATWVNSDPTINDHRWLLSGAYLTINNKYNRDLSKYEAIWQTGVFLCNKNEDIGDWCPPEAKQMIKLSNDSPSYFLCGLRMGENDYIPRISLSRKEVQSGGVTIIGNSDVKGWVYSSGDNGYICDWGEAPFVYYSNYNPFDDTTAFSSSPIWVDSTKIKLIEKTCYEYEGHGQSSKLTRYAAISSSKDIGSNSIIVRITDFGHSPSSIQTLSDYFFLNPKGGAVIRLCNKDGLWLNNSTTLTYQELR